MKFLKKNIYKILLISILILAAFLRSYDISSTPPGIYHDEAVNANNAIETLSSGDFKIFYTDNNGREGLFINLIALSFYSFGVGVWQLKLPSIVIGTLTVLGTYLLSKELFRKTKYEEHSEKIALLSSFFIATSFWHIDFSRIAFRGILTPLILTIGVILLLRAIRNNKWYLFAAAGLIFGLGGYAYPALQISPLLPIFAFLYFYLKNRKNLSTEQLRKYLGNFSIFFFASFLVLLPIFNYFSNNQNDASQRYSQLSILSSENPLYEVSKNTLLTLGEFNFKGDCNPRHNFDCQAQLFWLVGIFFIVGMMFFFKHRKQLPFALLLFWFFVLLVPAILTNEGVPHALRSIGSLVPAYIFAGFGAFLTFNLLVKKEDSWEANERFEKYLKQLHRIRKELIVLSFLLLAFSGYIQYHTYFDSWKFNSKTIDQFGEKYSNIAAKINGLPEGTKKYVVVNTNGIWVDSVPVQAETIKFFTKKNENIQYLREDELESFIPEKNSVLVPLDQNIPIFKKIQKAFPGGTISIDENVIFYTIN